MSSQVMGGSSEPPPVPRALDERLRSEPIVAFTLPRVSGTYAAPLLVELESGLQAIVKLESRGKALEGLHLKGRADEIRHEVAAKNIADCIGVGDLVPVTVLREVPDPDDPDGPFQLASLQVLVDGEDSPSIFRFTSQDRIRAAAFDLVIDHKDRIGHNWLGRAGEDGTLVPVLIDNGLAFGHPRGYGIRSAFVEVAQHQAHQHVATVEIDVACDAIVDAVDGLLDDATRDAVLRRLRTLARPLD